MLNETTVKNRLTGSGSDEELIDVLIAISVVAKRLAENLRKQLQKGDKQDGKNE